MVDSAAKASSAADAVVTMSEFGIEVPGTWGQAGGNKSAEPRTYFESGSREEEVAGGPASRDNLTLSRPFKRDRDIELCRYFDRHAGSARGTVTKQFTDEDGNAYGDPVVWSDSLVLACNWPDHDPDGGDTTARVEIVLRPGRLV